MPAPKRPNTAAATAKVVRNAQERKAADLRAAGWTVIPPEADHPIRRLVTAACEWRRMRSGTPTRPKAEAADLIAAVDDLTF